MFRVEPGALQDRQYPKLLVSNDGIDFEKLDALLTRVRQIGIHFVLFMKAFLKIPTHMSWPFGKPGGSRTFQVEVRFVPARQRCLFFRPGCVH